jgi:trk system potassium uptake protein TrkA
MSLQSTNDASSEDVSTSPHFVLGGKQSGLAMAEHLHENGHAVTVVNEVYRSSDVPGIRGDPTDIDLLEESGLEEASTVVVATKSDARNILICQLVSVNFDVPRTLVLIHDPNRLDPIVEAGHEPICVTAALFGSVTERL